MLLCIELCSTKTSGTNQTPTQLRLHHHYELLFLTKAVHFVSILFTPGYLLLLRNSPCRFTHKILVKVLRNVPGISHPIPFMQ